MVAITIILTIIIMTLPGDALASSEAARLLPLQIDSQEEVSCSHHKLFSSQQYVITINIVAPIAICIGGSLLIISKPKSNGVEEIGI